MRGEEIEKEAVVRGSENMPGRDSCGDLSRFLSERNEWAASLKARPLKTHGCVMLGYCLSLERGVQLLFKATAAAVRRRQTENLQLRHKVHLGTRSGRQQLTSESTVGLAWPSSAVSERGAKSLCPVSLPRALLLMLFIMIITISFCSRGPQGHALIHTSMRP